MTELRTAHTADIDVGARSAIRGLLDAAFGGSRRLLAGTSPG